MRLRVLAATAVVLAGPLVPATAEAGPVGPQSGTLVVDTIGAPSSPVVSATGVFAGCTSVSDLDNQSKFTRGIALFRGLKLVTCDGGTLQLSYQVTIDKKAPGDHGSWQVVSGTGAYANSHGGGRLLGDYVNCDPMGTDFCVLDTYTGALG